jgi:muramoyltetrapeptide carboxypeptidase LdcA involved in peptidoglycan recycling
MLWFDDRMAHDLIRPVKARRGDRVAVLSPSFAAAGAFPAVHEQAMRRLTVVCAGVPFGHTRPQWIIPHGGMITVDGTTRRVTADYS